MFCMKYKDIFKAWWFWLLIALNMVLEIVGHLQQFDNIFAVELVGYLIGSFVIVWVGTSLVYGIIRLFKRKQKT